jgi:cell surface protein SprA
MARGLITMPALNLPLGATIMHLTEQPITQKETAGEESISNTIWGFDANYSSSSRFLPGWLIRSRSFTTKAPSSVIFSGEFAKLMPGSPGALKLCRFKKRNILPG